MNILDEYCLNIEMDEINCQANHKKGVSWAVWGPLNGGWPQSAQRCREAWRDRDHGRSKAVHRLLLPISAWPSTAQGGPLLRGEASDRHLLLAITKGTAISKMKLHQVYFLKQIVRYLLAALVQFGTDVDATLPPACQAHKCTSLRAKCLVLLERHFLD